MNEFAIVKRRRWTLQSFVDFCVGLYGDRYDYSQTFFSTTNDRVSVRCITHDHTFTPFANDHLRGKGGCPKCKADATGLRVREVRGVTQDSFLRRAREVHGNKYDYSKTTVRLSTDKIEVVCPVHRVSFFPTLANHLNNGTGCPECGRLAMSRKRALPLDAFLARAKEVHADLYDYSEVKLAKLHDKVTIICRRHGAFGQLAYDHIGGHGCEKCGGLSSAPTQEIVELLQLNGLSVETEVTLPNGSRLDIYCPKLRIALEYNGLRWHSEEFQGDPGYHLKKTLEANQYGIHLIHIWEDDWVFSKEKTLAWLKSQLGLSQTKLNARSLEVRQVRWSALRDFVKLHHMQGRPSACELCYGLYTRENELVGAMIFSTKNCEEGEICLERFCSVGHIRGGFSKILAAFKREHGLQYNKIVSFSDRSWSSGNVYLTNGFRCVFHREPRYWWVKGQRRFNRRYFQKKYLPTKLAIYDPNLSEAENCRANGFRKLYDCGVTKWEMSL